MAIMRTFQLWFVFTVVAGFHLGISLALQRSDLLLDPTSPPPLTLTSHGIQNISISLRFREEPQDTSVVSEEDALLRCSGESDQGEPTIAWFYEGQPISDSDVRWSIESDGSVLRVSTTNRVAGNYYCLVSNEAGALRSGLAQLRLAAMEDDLKVPDDQKVPESQSLALFCSVNSTPPAVIRWEVNQLPLPKDDRYVPLPNGSLFIGSAKSSDAGNFRCIATNHLLTKTIYSRKIEVTILPPPEITSPPLFIPVNYLPNKTVLVGETVEFHCFMNGHPAPTIQWYKGDTILPSQNTPILTISQAKLTDGGKYTCKGFNSAGDINQTFYLNIFEKPTFKVVPASISSPAANTIRLSCSANGNPQPKLIWYKNGTLLNVGGHIKLLGTELVFTTTFTYDAGIYQCMAVNSVGQIWTSAQIKINKSQNPDPPTDVKCRPFGDTKICLSWKPPANVQVLSYIISSFFPDYSLNHDYVLSNITTYFEASGLKSSTNYSFYIRSVTKKAGGDNSESVTCQTGLNGSRNLTITPRGHTSVVLKWNSLSTDTFCNGTKDFFRISWRQLDDVATYERTKDTEFIVNGLLPGFDYLFQVSAENSLESGTWIPYTMPDVLDDSNYTSQDILNAPTNFQSDVISSTEIQLEWETVTNARYYTVCYIPVRDNRKCQENKILKSTSRKLKLENLDPNTEYLVQVRAYDFDNIPGIISQPIKVETLSDVPSKVLNLQYQAVNSSALCIQWTPPKYERSELQSYKVSYTPDPNWPLEKWMVRNVSTESNEGCAVAHTHGEKDLVSVVLSNLTSDHEYMIVVTALNKHGLGISAMLTITLNASDSVRENKSDLKINGEGVIRKSKIGIIIGILLALMAISGCIIFILLKRRCFKRHVFGRPRLAPSSDYHQPVAHYNTHLGSVQVKTEEPCSTEPLEIDYLVPDENTQPHQEAKGGRDIPNGQINGRSITVYQNGHLSNGSLRITENPQYMALEQNGDIPSIDQYDSDSNSNVKNSKVFDFHKLFEKSKTTPNCYPHFGDNHSSRRSSLCSLNNESLNVTQSTNLDESQNMSHSCPNDSLLSSESKLTQTLNHLNQSAQSNSRMSPILVPNG